MRGNHFGKMLSMTSFGESHGPAVGVVLDGVPSGLKFSHDDLWQCLKKRAPGHIKGTSPRKEDDCPEVLSGIFEDQTTGTPICVIVRNTNQKSQDYEHLKENPRIGHGDQTYLDKYGVRDHRGGGRSSGRETIARVIGGYFASLVIPQVKVTGFSQKIGPFVFEGLPQSLDEGFGAYGFPIPEEEKKIEQYLLALQKQGDSVGGRISLVVDQLPSGLGEPAFDKLKADLAKAIMSVGAVTSFSYGLGERFAELNGKDAILERQNFGGIEGGISNGERMIMTVTIKPTSTVGKSALSGRHDPCIVPRVIPVLEAMVIFTLADHYLRQQAYSTRR